MISLVSYMVIVFIWAGMFYGISSSCELELDNFREAFYLSLETFSTVGYGLPNSPYFGGCLSGVFVLSSQVRCWSDGRDARCNVNVYIGVRGMSSFLTCNDVVRELRRNRGKISARFAQITTHSLGYM